MLCYIVSGYFFWVEYVAKIILVKEFASIHSQFLLNIFWKVCWHSFLSHIYLPQTLMFASLLVRILQTRPTDVIYEFSAAAKNASFVGLKLADGFFSTFNTIRSELIWYFLFLVIFALLPIEFVQILIYLWDSLRLNVILSDCT